MVKVRQSWLKLQRIMNQNTGNTTRCVVSISLWTFISETNWKQVYMIRLSCIMCLLQQPFQLHLHVLSIHILYDPRKMSKKSVTAIGHAYCAKRLDSFHVKVVNILVILFCCSTPSQGGLRGTFWTPLWRTMKRWWLPSTWRKRRQMPGESVLVRLAAY